MRKRGRVAEAAEKFSVVKTMQAIADANVVVLVLDATQEISEQDAHIAGFILEAGRALVLAVNKWEAVDAAQRDTVKRTLRAQARASCRSRGCISSRRSRARASAGS